jgi:hypothetical protein
MSTRKPTTPRTIRSRELREFYRQLQQDAWAARREFIERAFDRGAELRVKGSSGAFMQRLNEMWFSVPPVRHAELRDGAAV